jgi:hypothetical protein
MTDRSAYPTSKRRLGDDGGAERVGPDAATRLQMVWQLTLQA